MIIDSNVLIYASSARHPELRRFVEENAPSISIVTKIETRGYHELSPTERVHLEAFFQDAPVLGITDSIADRAILLRQQRRMTLGDSLIAATALDHDEPLVTHNLSDFSWIDGLELIDPLK